jgi:glycosyltransferase involved in cell wall biosynthesis
MGMPVVCTDVGALSEIVAHEQSGVLVPSDDPVAMARATERILSDETLARSMSHAARRCAEAFDAAKTFPLWTHLVARAVEA